MKYFLLTVSTLGLISPAFAQTSEINCTPAPDCASLGYTESSCPDGAGLKCPFGNKWFCAEEIHQEGPKFKWGECSGLAKSCNIGDIVYSDGACASTVVSGKTPIAVVVYKSADGNCAQAIALKMISNNKWSSEFVDISTLPNFNAEQAVQDFASCENTAKIIAAGDRSKYPAAWAAYDYKTNGTSIGDWCLPAAGIMTSIKNNISVINAGLALVDGEHIGTSSWDGGTTPYWSSSEECDNQAWYFNVNDNDGLGCIGYGSAYGKKRSREIRPVLEF